MSYWRISSRCRALAASLAVICGTALAGERSAVLGSVEGMGLAARAYADGTYSIAAPGIAGPVIRSEVAAGVDSAVMSSTAYPRHKVEVSESPDALGAGPTLTITHSG